jgi:hypothetical protein
MKWTCVVLIVVNIWSYLPEQKHEYHSSIDIVDTDMVADLKNNICTFEVKTTFEENIKVEFYSLPEIKNNERYTVGSWSEDDNTIRLESSIGTDLDTVAHEVSHAVDTLMGRHKPKEQHYEAYLQGALTECVWQIVQSRQ